MATKTRAEAALEFVYEGLRSRNETCHRFFDREAERIARAARDIAERFRRGGRLIAIGRHQYETDAQHVEVEFVHPVLVGKRALPALDFSAAPAAAIASSMRSADTLLVLGPPGGDPFWDATILEASNRNLAIVLLPGRSGEYAFEAGSDDPFVHQEILEIIYHTLWESVHVFLESSDGQRGERHDAGAAAFLYPFLSGAGVGGEVLGEVASSIRAKVAEDAELRSELARAHANAMVDTAEAIRRRVEAGGKLLLFGNGGSATDANDWALDCLASPKGAAGMPAISLAGAAACVSAVANDVGPAELFVRPLMAHAEPGDVAIGISTSGGSRNVITALAEARRRGLLTVALVGHGGGEVLRSGVADHAIVVGSASIPRIQEVQASAYHIIVDLLAAV